MQANTPNRAHPLKCGLTTPLAHTKKITAARKAHSFDCLVPRFSSCLYSSVDFWGTVPSTISRERASIIALDVVALLYSSAVNHILSIPLLHSLFFLYIIIIDVTIIVGCRAVLFFLHGFLSLPLRCLCKPWLYAHCHRLSRCSHWMWTLHFGSPCQRPTSSLPYPSVLTSTPTHVVVKLWHTAIRERNISKRIT